MHRRTFLKTGPICALFYVAGCSSLFSGNGDCGNGTESPGDTPSRASTTATREQSIDQPVFRISIEDSIVVSHRIPSGEDLVQDSNHTHVIQETINAAESIEGGQTPNDVEGFFSVDSNQIKSSIHLYSSQGAYLRLHDGDRSTSVLKGPSVSNVGIAGPIIDVTGEDLTNEHNEGMRAVQL